MALVRVCDICKKLLEDESVNYVNLTFNSSDNGPLRHGKTISICEDCFKTYVNETFLETTYKRL